METLKQEIKSAKALNAQLKADFEKQSRYVQKLGEDVRKTKRSESKLREQVNAKEVKYEALKKRVEEFKISGEKKLLEQKLVQLQNEVED